jgi:hypothetical protein
MAQSIEQRVRGQAGLLVDQMLAGESAGDDEAMAAE